MCFTRVKCGETRGTENNGYARQKSLERSMSVMACSQQLRQLRFSLPDHDCPRTTRRQSEHAAD
jgi:hypothetical protein